LGYQILIASGIITQHLRNIFFTTNDDIGEYDTTPQQIVARAGYGGVASTVQAHPTLTKKRCEIFICNCINKVATEGEEQKRKAMRTGISVIIISRAMILLIITVILKMMTTSDENASI
jgi:hypothetical protein